MPEEHPLAPAENGLVIRPSTDLVRLPDGGSSALSEIISRSLVHIQASQSLGTLHRIGEHELHGPDYRLVCAWAQELGLTAEDVLIVLLRKNEDLDFQTQLVSGRFRSICVDRNVLPIKEFHSAEKLYLNRLHFAYLEDRDTGEEGFNLNRTLKVDLSAVPNLTELYCGDNHLIELDLSAVPNLTILDCGGNQLSGLDLSTVPNLTDLSCAGSQLSELDLSTVPNLKKLNCASTLLTKLDLSAVPNLTQLCWSNNHLMDIDLTPIPNLKTLYCARNHLSDLDLSAIPNLERLNCDNNQLTGLKLSAVPNLRSLSCGRNHLSDLDLSAVPDLRILRYDQHSTRLIQLPTQNF